MTKETEQQINDFRKKLDFALDKFSVEDFRRVHAKFFGGLIALEVGFKKRFPEESAKYELEIYGDDK